ncbi:PREDICTED: cell differentiation protein RCD1 homolog [Tarenaya hassleriana]|uniref:cell differentiation protein RCD1 homolog n=1 Tax=Tarenaya hassleriana TaxID=28532 RepID=UPI00053C94AD|nr:PREDICTED: cell differentiation protein RCD1 homolog [Tarenaya hassleriana]
MANLPDSLYEDYNLMATLSSAAGASTSRAPPSVVTICRWINDLQFPPIREFALQNLSDNRNSFEDLALLLWSSTASVATLLQEVIGVYPELSLPILTLRKSTRVYNALLLFQCIAKHPETRTKFLTAMMLHYFYPLLQTRYTDRPREYLRLGGLGILAQLLKGPDYGATVHLLIHSDAVRSCLHCIDVGDLPSQTLATFILHKILMTEEGLQYCCVLAERYFFIDSLLKQLLLKLATMNRPPPPSLLQLVAGCYYRLSMKARACEGIKQYIPVLLVDNTFAELLAEDPLANDYRNKLLLNLRNKALY